jgi:ectoine hydroxylase-related dioxygenase (phytanoyl-CoA dioxygenase family)
MEWSSPSLFKDPELALRFREDGYVIINNWLDSEAIEALKALYATNFPAIPEHFYSSSFAAEEGKRRTVSEAISSLFTEKTSAHFQQYKSLGAGFLAKPPGLSGHMPIHRDWTVLDESKYTALTIWVPLIDTDEKNGALKVWKGSHKITSGLYGPSIPDELDEIKSSLEAYMQVKALKAGDAIIFNHALLHSSCDNDSTESRIAVTFGLAHAEAQMKFYHFTPPASMEEYDMPDDLFLQYDKLKPVPRIGTIVKRFTYQAGSVTKEMFAERFAKNYSYHMKQLFKTEEAQKQFEEEGFVLIKSVLSEADCNNLKAYYESLQVKSASGYGFHVTMDQQDKSMVRDIVKTINDVAVDKILTHFENAKANIASFVVKESGEQSLVPVHQDWTFVEDEGYYSSVTTWIPLLDVNMNNGALGVIKGSHKFVDAVRGSPTPQIPSPLTEHLFTILPYMQIIDMKAGDMLVFNNKTFHASPPNLSGITRLGIGIGVSQAEAKLCHYYLKPNADKKVLLKYAIDNDFFYKYENASLSKMYDAGQVIEDYPVLESLPFECPQLDTDTLVALIEKHKNPINPLLVQQLSAMMPAAAKQEASNPEIPQVPTESGKTIDTRPLWIKYSPLNVYREIVYRLSSKA